MTNKVEGIQNKKKGFFGKIVEKLDKKLEEKSRKAPCCSPGKDKEKGSACC